MDEIKDWQGKSILVVDDSPKIQMELTAAYSDLGLGVIGVANDGIEAIELYKSEKPDLVSLDIVMPVMHGIECYRKLVEIDQELKILFVSCLAFDPSLIEAFTGELHPYQFIPKPWSSESLKKGLNTIYRSDEVQKVIDPVSPSSRNSTVA